MARNWKNEFMAKRRFCFSLFLTMIASLAGCSTASLYYLNDGISPFPATSANKIAIFSERATPDTAYIEMGYVSVHVTNGGSGDELKAALKKVAASIGADAVIDFRLFGLTAGGIAVKYEFFDYRIYGLNAGGIAVKYK
jgi:hypothetical protein